MCRHPKHFRIRLNKATVQCLHHECGMRRYTVPVEPGDPDFETWMKSPPARVETALDEEDIAALFPTAAPDDVDPGPITPEVPHRYYGRRINWGTTGTTTTAMNTGTDENG